MSKCLNANNIGIFLTLARVLYLILGLAVLAKQIDESINLEEKISELF